MADPPRRPVPMAEAIRSFARESGLVQRLDQAAIVLEWADLVGPQIAAVTTPDAISPDGVLRVRVATPAWANELAMMTPRIIARLNAGRKGRVKEIRWYAA